MSSISAWFFFLSFYLLLYSTTQNRRCCVEWVLHELTGFTKVTALKKCTAALLVLLKGTSLLVTPSAKLTFIGFLNYKESTGGTQWPSGLQNKWCIRVLWKLLTRNETFEGSQRIWILLQLHYFLNLINWSLVMVYDELWCILWKDSLLSQIKNFGFNDYHWI